MKLESTEILALRVADGLASPEEQAAAVAAGVDIQGDRALRRVIARALAAPPLTLPGEPPFAGQVLEAAGVTDADLGPVLRAALNAGQAPGLSLRVLEALGVPAAWPTGADIATAHRWAAGRPPALAAGVLAQTHPGVADAGRGVAAALDGGPEPELGDAVLGVSGLPAALRAALEPGVAPDLSRGVLAALGLGDADTLVGGAVASEAGPTPDLGDAIMAAVGVADAPAPVADAVAFQAGAAPDLWAGIATEIGVDDGGDVAPGAADDLPAAASSTAELIELAPRRRWWLPAAGVAVAAAAAVLAVIGLPTERVSDGHGALAAHIHLESGHAMIEEISAGPEAMVQVLQFEEDAPTIIFIDVLEEPEGSDGDEGVPL